MLATITLVIGVLMTADALFTLCNVEFVESHMQEMFPSFNAKKLAVAEGVAGVGILLTHSFGIYWQ